MLTEEQYQKVVKAIILFDEDDPDELIEAIKDYREPSVLTVPDNCMVLFDVEKMDPFTVENFRIEPGIGIPVHGDPRDVIQFVKVEKSK